MQRFRIYLQGIKFKLVTDCNSLKMTLYKKEINQQHTSFEYEVEHRAGSRMQHVDALSRTVEILVVEDNPLESNLVLSQSRDSKVNELRGYLKKKKKWTSAVWNARQINLQKKVWKYIVLCIWRNGSPCDEKISWQSRTLVKRLKPCIGFRMLHVISKGSVPFAMLHIDHYGTVDKKCLVKQHILVVKDSFMKFTRLFSVKTAASKEVIHYLKEYFNSYSALVPAGRVSRISARKWYSTCSSI